MCIEKFSHLPSSPYISPEIRLSVLPPESDLPRGLGRWCHQFTDGIENDPELLIVPFFHFSKNGKLAK
jgi:hypothetical protein